MFASRSRNIIQLAKNRRFSTIFETKNTIKEHRQKYYSNPATGAENPTYLKEKGDYAVFAVAGGGVVFGVVFLLYELTNMMFGINKKK